MSKEIKYYRPKYIEVVLIILSLLDICDAMDEDKEEVYPKLALHPGNHFSYLIDIKKTTLNNLALIVYLFTIKRMLKKKKKLFAKSLRST